MIDVVKKCMELIESLKGQDFQEALPKFQKELWEIGKSYNLNGSQVFGFYMDWDFKQNKLKEERLQGMNGVKFTCIAIHVSSGTREPFETFEVDSQDIDYVQEEALVDGAGETIPVLYLKNGKRCIPIAKWDDPQDVEIRRELLLSLMR